MMNSYLKKNPLHHCPDDEVENWPEKVVGYLHREIDNICLTFRNFVAMFIEISKPLDLSLGCDIADMVSEKLYIFCGVGVSPNLRSNDSKVF